LNENPPGIGFIGTQNQMIVLNNAKYTPNEKADEELKININDDILRYKNIKKNKNQRKGKIGKEIIIDDMIPTEILPCQDEKIKQNILPFKISLNNIEYKYEKKYYNSVLPIYDISDTMFYTSEDDLIANREVFPTLTIYGEVNKKMIITKEMNLVFYATLLHYGYYFISLKYFDLIEIGNYIYKILFLTIYYKNNYTLNNYHHYFFFLLENFKNNIKMKFNYLIIYFGLASYINKFIIKDMFFMIKDIETLKTNYISINKSIKINLKDDYMEKMSPELIDSHGHAKEYKEIYLSKMIEDYKNIEKKKKKKEEEEKILINKIKNKK